ncbi:MAG TPA: ribosome-associated translation inhibitor RaiA [Anaerolineales bacterium]|nr:ribosome-associated translation inhibitor RaiA [Anaerolineales bacterium]
MSATVVISGRGISISEKVREYAEKKVSKLDHYLPEIGEVRVDLSAERTARDADDRQVVQLTVPVKRGILRCEERSGDMLTSLDMALDKMHRQIERYKTKRRRGRGEGDDLTRAAMAEEVETESDTEADTSPRIVRRKRFHVTPMTEAEAIEQMALSQHENFFIFYNADTAKVTVLYVRKDGNYGLIEPEVA